MPMLASVGDGEKTYGPPRSAVVLAASFGGAVVGESLGPDRRSPALVGKGTLTGRRARPRTRTRFGWDNRL